MGYSKNLTLYIYFFIFLRFEVWVHKINTVQYGTTSILKIKKNFIIISKSGLGFTWN